MNTLTISKPANPGLWMKIWSGLRVFDEAIHHDPVEALHRRTESLEARLKDLERMQAK